MRYRCKLEILSNTEIVQQLHILGRLVSSSLLKAVISRGNISLVDVDCTGRLEKGCVGADDAFVRGQIASKA